MLTFLIDKRGNQVEFFSCALSQYKQILADFRSKNLSLHEIIQLCKQANFEGLQLIHTFERCKAMQDKAKNPDPDHTPDHTPAPDHTPDHNQKSYDLKRQRMIRRHFFESIDKAAKPTIRRPQKCTSTHAAKIAAGKLALNSADISI